MMRRLFWLGVGAAAAVVVARKLAATKEKYSPTGLLGQASVLADKVTASIREIGADIRDGMAEREHELTAALLGESRAPAAGGGSRSVRDDIDEPEYEF
jgi:hypothetical protein